MDSVWDQLIRNDQPRRMSSKGKMPKSFSQLVLKHDESGQGAPQAQQSQIKKTPSGIKAQNGFMSPPKISSPRAADEPWCGNEQQGDQTKNQLQKKQVRDHKHHQSEMFELFDGGMGAAATRDNEVGKK